MIDDVKHASQHMLNVREKSARNGVTAVQTALVLVAIATAVIAGVRGIGNLASTDLQDTAGRIGNPASLKGKFAYTPKSSSGGSSGSGSGSSSGGSSNSGSSSGGSSSGSSSGSGSGSGSSGSSGSNSGGSSSGSGSQGGLCP